MFQTRTINICTYFVECKLFKLPLVSSVKITVIFALFKGYVFLSFLFATLFSMSFLFLGSITFFFFGLDHFLLSYTGDNYEVIVKIRYFVKKGCNYIVTNAG